MEATNNKSNKTKALRILIKQCVREVFQEELKELVLEAIKSPKNVIHETQTPPAPRPNYAALNESLNSTPAINSNPGSARSSYKEMMNMTSDDIIAPAGTFRPDPNPDVMNGSLPKGDVSMDMISQFINK